MPAEYARAPGARAPPPGAAAAHPAESMRGRLFRRLQFWRTFAPDFVLEWIEHGYEIQWERAGPPPPRRAPNHSSAREHASFVREAVADLAAKGAIVRAREPPIVISPLGVVNRRGKLRLILDLTHVNEYLARGGTRFKYENVYTAADVLREGDLLATIDLAAAYHHIDMAPESWPYLGFEFEGQIWTFCQLPFGLATACWVFTKITAALAGKWRSVGIRLMHYLDDFLVAALRAAFERTVNFVLADLERAGFSFAKEKLLLEPTSLKVFIGYEFDTVAGVFKASPARIAEALNTLESLIARRRRVTARALARAAGQIVSMTPALGHAARLFTRAMYADLDRRRSWNGHLTLSDDTVAELQFWLHRLRERNGGQIWRDTYVHVVEVHTDASDFAWGGHSQDGAVALGQFSADEKLTGSCARELLAILRTAGSLPALDNCAARFLVDNKGCEWIWDGGSRKPHLNLLAKEIFATCERRALRLAVQWIPRELNELADELSKWRDPDDWQLNPDTFRRLDQLWGPHTLDAFASAGNTQLPRFFSRFHCPETAGVDAFAADWSAERCWLNPPFGAIGAVIRHARRCGAAATLVCPCWPSRPWWNLICPDGQRFAPYITDARALWRAPDLFIPGPSRREAPGAQPPGRRVLALRLDFSAPAASHLGPLQALTGYL